MPIYEYKCGRGHVTELTRKVEGRHEPVACPRRVAESFCREPAVLTPSVPAHAQVDGGTGAGLQGG